MKQEFYRGIDLARYDLIWEIIKHYQDNGIDLISFSDTFVCGYRDGYEKAFCDFKAQIPKLFEKQPDQI
jgi:hypothetical protein